jgi:hypothetical protein
MKLKSPGLFIWLPLLVGWLFDYLFWRKMVGISFAIFVTVVVVLGLFLARREGIKPAPWALALLVPIAFFTVMTFVRAEPMTSFLNYLAVVLLLGTFAHSFIGGRWPFYSIKQYLVGAFNLGFSAVSRQAGILKNKPEDEGDPEQKEKRRSLTWSIVRGLLLSIPVVMVLAALLASADLIFEQGLSKFLDLLNLDNLAELLWRGFIIAFVAYLLAGIYLHAFYKNHDEEISIDEKSNFFLGFVESSIVLGSVNLLFLVFVGIQFRYFFGGNTNIHIDGYTYAEYARRGFGEMVITAFICLLLLQVLSAVTRREGKTQRYTFSTLGSALVVLVGIMLVSAFQRLKLYENAYGFSDIRAYTHVFIFWLAGLLLATMLLVITRRQRFFTFAMCMAALGFILSLDVMNVDAFVVNQNVARAEAWKVNMLSEKESFRRGVGAEKLDFQYLASLSTDALPALVDMYQQKPELAEELSAAIACHAYHFEYYDYSKAFSSDYVWSSFHLSRYLAQREWQKLHQLPESDRFQVKIDKSRGESAYMMVHGEKYYCYSFAGWD